MSKPPKKSPFEADPTREIVGFNASEFMESSDEWARQPTKEVDGFDSHAMMEELGGERSGAMVLKPEKKEKPVKVKVARAEKGSSSGIEDEERAFFSAV